MSSSDERRTSDDELRATATNEVAAPITATYDEAAPIADTALVLNANSLSNTPTVTDQDPPQSPRPRQGPPLGAHGGGGLLTGRVGCPATCDDVVSFIFKKGFLLAFGPSRC